MVFAFKATLYLYTHAFSLIFCALNPSILQMIIKSDRISRVVIYRPGKGHRCCLFYSNISFSRMVSDAETNEKSDVRIVLQWFLNYRVYGLDQGHMCRPGVWSIYKPATISRYVLN